MLAKVINIDVMAAGVIALAIVGVVVLAVLVWRRIAAMTEDNKQIPENHETLSPEVSVDWQGLTSN